MNEQNVPAPRLLRQATETGIQEALIALEAKTQCIILNPYLG